MRPTTLSSSSAALVGNSKDLVGEILIRLPVSSVMRFRLVCKEWCSLTSTKSSSCFVVQYFNHSAVIRFGYPFISKSDHFNILFFNLDDDNSNNTKMKVVREYVRGGVTNFFHKKIYYDIKLFSSYRGLLLFTAKPTRQASMYSMSSRFRRWLTKDEEEKNPALIVYNPVTKEQYTVATPAATHVYCGFYYHSPTKEYRILYQLVQSVDPHLPAKGVVQFLVFGLQTQVMRVLKLPGDHHHHHHHHSIAAYYYPDPSTLPAVISNGSLHWIVSPKIVSANTYYYQIPYCSQTILCFGMESEEFRLMPHPTLSHACYPWHRRHHMNLLEMDGGILCLCDGYYHGGILEIYVMEDYKKWTWVRRYHVDLSKYSKYLHRSRCLYGEHYKALQILQGDQLLLHYHPSMFIRDLKLSDRWLYVKEEYALYSLNQQHEDGHQPALASSSTSSTGMVRKSRSNITKKREGFQVLIDEPPGEEELIGRLRRMIIYPKKKKKPPVVTGNMVVLTPSLASFQHNRTSTPPLGTGTGTGTFFSIRNQR